MNCRFCGGDLFHWLDMPIDAKKDELTPFNAVFRCTKCQVGMLVPQPKAEEIASLYRLPAYYTHGESHIKEVRPRFWDKVLTKLAWKTDFQNPFDPRQIAGLLSARGEICDLGCGHGLILNQFKELGFSVTGVEPDPSSRKLAAAAGIRVLEGTAESIPAELKDRTFDLVVMTHALEHCIDPVKALENAHALTSPGGYFYCEVPNCGCVHFEDMNICSENFDAPRHLWFFTASGLRKALESRGFIFDAWRFMGFTRLYSPSWRGWEMTIFERLAKHDRTAAASATRHTYAKSLSILARSAFTSAQKKYDSVGIIAKRA